MNSRIWSLIFSMFFSSNLFAKPVGECVSKEEIAENQQVETFSSLAEKAYLGYCLVVTASWAMAVGHYCAQLPQNSQGIVYAFAGGALIPIAPFLLLNSPLESYIVYSVAGSLMIGTLHTATSLWWYLRV